MQGVAASVCIDFSDATVLALAVILYHSSRKPSVCGICVAKLIFLTVDFHAFIIHIRKVRQGEIVCFAYDLKFSGRECAFSQVYIYNAVTALFGYGEYRKAVVACRLHHRTAYNVCAVIKALEGVITAVCVDIRHFRNFEFFYFYNFVVCKESLVDLIIKQHTLIEIGGTALHSESNIFCRVRRCGGGLCSCRCCRCF